MSVESASGARVCGRVEGLVHLVGRPLLGDGVGGRLGQGLGGHVAHQLAAEEDPQVLGVGDLADDGGVEVPAVADRLDPLPLLRRHDGQHALLALADHDLPGLHVGLAQGHPVGVQVDAHLALGRHLAGRGGDAGGAQVLQRHETGRRAAVPGRPPAASSR